MTAPAPSDTSIQYEGPGVASELWGGVQANFLVHTAGHHAREIAVLLNDQALAYLAQRTNSELTPEFGDGAARHIGERWLRHKLEAHESLPPVIVLARASLEAAGPFLDALLAELGA